MGEQTIINLARWRRRPEWRLGNWPAGRRYCLDGLSAAIARHQLKSNCSLLTGSSQHRTTNSNQHHDNNDDAGEQWARIPGKWPLNS
jgi:hypothetical protein